MNLAGMTNCYKSNSKMGKDEITHVSGKLKAKKEIGHEEKSFSNSLINTSQSRKQKHKTSSLSSAKFYS
jgi:hypothetical protein